MAQVEVILPKMGESVAEATIIKWLKNEGDRIEEDESLVEIATDKVDSEIPSPVAGVVSKILVREGEVVKVGQAIANITTEGEGTSSPADKPQAIETKEEAPEIQPPPQTKPQPTPQQATQAIAATAPASLKIATTGRDGSFYSPLVKNIAKMEGISMDTLETIPGTGKNGRVTKNDILSWLSGKDGKGTESSKAAATDIASEPVLPAGKASEETEIIEMGRVRKLIADHMVLSKQTSPHVTSFIEADVTNMVNWRNKIKQQFEEREGQKITFTPIFIEAAVKALRDYPMINVSLEGNNIIKKNFIHIGMATALPSGNLIVPVIKNADMLNLAGLVKTVNDLAMRARSNELEPDEIQNGTFTITNLGSFGNVMGTPIINQPQAAILATGIIKKKPVVIETAQGDSIAIRHMMFLSLSYDHRVVDGALGGNYLKKVADYLEQFDTDRNI